MKIGIDVRLWNQTGVGRYIRSLIGELSKIDKKNEYILFAKSEDITNIKSVVSSQWSVVPADIPWHSFAEQVKFPRILNKEKLDLMHFPYFSVPILYNGPFVITVHDLIVNNFSTGRASTLPLPLYMAKRVGYFTILRSAIGRSKKIIVPSDAVKDDLLNSYGFVKSGKIVVTHEGGFETTDHEPLTTNPKITGRYFLRVGNFYPHKNVEGLLTAFRLLLEQRLKSKDQPKLVMVGKKDYFYERMQKLILKLGMDGDVIFLDNVQDGELVHLYKNALATIIPSYAEGFSLTAVEAMALGSPVVASGIPVHHEVCGDAAIFFDPKNIENIVERMGFALDLTEQSRKELINQGKKQSKNFSWRKMAEETLHIYNSSV